MLTLWKVAASFVYFYYMLAGTLQGMYMFPMLAPLQCKIPKIKFGCQSHSVKPMFSYKG